MNKEILRIFSLFAVMIGIFLIIMQPFQPITGAVIDISSGLAKINFFIGLLLLILGIVFLLILAEKKK